MSLSESLPARGKQGLWDKVLNAVGIDIVSGTLLPGQTFTLNDLSERFGVSRTVAREAMRALESRRLVASSRKVGIKVLPRPHWDLLDEAIIRWRLSVESEYESQLTAICQLRHAVEPHAAYLAAQYASDQQRAMISTAIVTLVQTTRVGEEPTPEFIEADVNFHSLIYQASGNDMYVALSKKMAAALRIFLAREINPIPDNTALDLHVQAAQAIVAKNGDAAEAAMKELLAGIRTH